MAQFDPAYKITMGNEGGYANNPADPGGETYKGIAKNYWGAWQGWPIVHAAVAANPGVSAINHTLAANTELQGMVQGFYKQNFWDTVSLNSINDQQVANQLFDISVNMGSGTAGKMLQQAINTLPSTTTPLVVDGGVGPKTLAAANAAGGKALYDAVCAARAAKYEHIIANNPSMAQFRHSWFSRMPAYQA